MTKKVRAGSKVTFHLEGVGEHGDILDSTFVVGKPLKAVIGSRTILKGMEKALLGMSEHETKAVRLTAKEAYGPRNEDLVTYCARKKLPRNYTPAANDILSLSLDGGMKRPVTVLKVEDDRVLIDLNHPLCGKSITYTIKVLKVQ